MGFNFEENEQIDEKEEEREEVQFRLGKIIIRGTAIAAVLPVLFCLLVFLVVIGIWAVFVPHK